MCKYFVVLRMWISVFIVTFVTMFALHELCWLWGRVCVSFLAVHAFLLQYSCLYLTQEVFVPWLCGRLHCSMGCKLLGEVLPRSCRCLPRATFVLLLLLSILTIKGFFPPQEILLKFETNLFFHNYS